MICSRSHSNLLIWVLTQVRVTTKLELLTTLGLTITLVPLILILHFWFE